MPYLLLTQCIHQRRAAFHQSDAVLLTTEANPAVAEAGTLGAVRFAAIGCNGTQPSAVVMGHDSLGDRCARLKLRHNLCGVQLSPLEFQGRYPRPTTFITNEDIVALLTALIACRRFAVIHVYQERRLRDIL